MTTYTVRELRAADLLALILIAFGACLALIAVLTQTGGLALPWRIPLGLGIGAVSFATLGAVLAIKVRSLLRNGRSEPR